MPPRIVAAIVVEIFTDSRLQIYDHCSYFYLSLFEDEEIAAPADFEEEKRLDYNTNRRFLFTALVLFYLKGVVAMTTTPSSGQV